MARSEPSAAVPIYVIRTEASAVDLVCQPLESEHPLTHAAELVHALMRDEALLGSRQLRSPSGSSTSPSAGRRASRCRSRTVEEKATSSPRKWLADEEPRAVEDPMHVEKPFVRNLGDLTRVR